MGGVGQGEPLRRRRSWRAGLVSMPRCHSTTLLFRIARPESLLPRAIYRQFHARFIRSQSFGLYQTQFAVGSIGYPAFAVSALVKSC
jgi:hypothetical protein